MDHTRSQAGIGRLRAVSAAIEEPEQAPAGPSNLVLLGQLSFLSGTAQEMVYPLVPTFVVAVLGGSPLLLGLIEGLLTAGVTAGRVGAARILDRRGSPRRLLRVSYVVSLISRPLMALAPGIGAVVALRLADGLGKGGKDAPKDLLASLDAGTARGGRAFGVLRALDTIGSVAGPLIAGGLLLWLGHGSTGLRIVFALAAVPALGGLWALRRVRDAPPAPAHRHEHEPRPKLPAGFRVLLAGALVFGLANSSDTLLLLRARDAGLSAPQIAFAFAAVNLVYAAMAVPLGALSDRIGRRPLLLVAWSVYAAVYAGFGVAGAAWQLWVLFAAYGIYYASADGTLKAWIADLVPAERRGAAYGLYAAAAGLLSLPASLLAGALWDVVNPAAAFATGAGLAVIALVIVALSSALRYPPAPEPIAP